MATVVQFGEFELDLSDEVLRHNGIKLPINRRMFQVLSLLVERSGDVVTKAEFFEKVWGGSFVEDNNLTVTVTALRKVLGDTAKGAKFIENIPRKGYRFVAPVSIAESTGAKIPGHDAFTGNEIVKPVSATDRPNAKLSGRILAVAMGACLIAAITIAAFAYGRLLKLPGQVPKGIDSVAVLPFLSSDPDEEYLAEGLTDTVTRSLRQISGARVIDRNSSFQFKDRTVDAAEVRQQLDVRSVVTGRLEVSDDMLTVTIEVSNASGEVESWRREFRRSKEETFALAQDIAHSISQDLVSRPGNGQSANPARPTKDPEAYDLYLRGRHLWNKRSNPNIAKSIEFFRAAIDRDPTFAKAYVGLGKAYALASLKGQGISDDERIVLADGAVNRALEIDDSIGEAYAVIGINRVYHDWDFAGAETAFKRAIELEPTDATSQHWYAELLAMRGEFDESYRHYDIALSLDPLSLPIRTDTAFAHYVARDYDTSIALLEKAAYMDPQYWRTFEFMAETYRSMGMLDMSVNSIENRFAAEFGNGELSPADYSKLLRYTADLRKGLSADGATGYWRSEVRSGDPSPFYKAVAYSKLGENDKAFEYLEIAFSQHYSGMVWLKVAPDLDELHSDPRFTQLMKRVGF